MKQLRILQITVSSLPLILILLTATTKVSAFVSCRLRHEPFLVAASSSFLSQQPQPNHQDDAYPVLISLTPEEEDFYWELHEDIKILAQELWEGEELPCLSPTRSTVTINDASSASSPLFIEGEAHMPNNIPFSERGEYFRQQALKGCPRSQHSYGLLLWNGFVSSASGDEGSGDENGGLWIERNPQESAKFHAAAAYQHHLDGIAVFGGCLRTGTGLEGVEKQSSKMKKTNSKSKQSTTSKVLRKRSDNLALGLKIIDFCSSVGNPSGVNKKGALLESNGDESKSVKLYKECVESGRANAFLRFNLGWSLIQGFVDADSSSNRVQKDVNGGIDLWKEATELAPDEVTEEAAWNLYKEYEREDPMEAQKWLDLANDLGYYE